MAEHGQGIGAWGCAVLLVIALISAALVVVGAWIAVLWVGALA